MSLRFELGEAQAPRGHAVLYAHVSGAGDRIVATYCVVLPIQFSIGKYLPPILMGQMPFGMAAAETDVSAVPIPPMLEDMPSEEAVRQLAERRGDDLVDLGTLVLGDDSHRMTFAAEACAEYGELYVAYRQQWPEPVSSSRGQSTPLDDLDVNEVITSMLPERDRLGEMARNVGQARYALEVGDTRQIEEVEATLGRIARSLPEKYRAEQIAGAALRRDQLGPRLAELYLQRAYRLLDEDYAAIPPIEREIHELESGSGGSSTSAS